MYSYGFLSRGFTDRREILHGGSATSRTGLLLFFFGGGDSPEMSEFWASTGAIWRDMLLAEALVDTKVKETVNILDTFRCKISCRYSQALIYENSL